jgi:hypothetical protein
MSHRDQNRFFDDIRRTTDVSGLAGSPSDVSQVPLSAMCSAADFIRSPPRLRGAWSAVVEVSSARNFLMRAWKAAKSRQAFKVLSCRMPNEAMPAADAVYTSDHLVHSGA